MSANVPPGQQYECPRCFTIAPWTDGTVKAEGAVCDEFWCQNCGHEVPLEDCCPVEDEQQMLREDHVALSKQVRHLERLRMRLETIAYGTDWEVGSAQDAIKDLRRTLDRYRQESGR